MSFNAQVTTTDSPTLLTLADGDATSGSKLGHISVGSKRLPSPLEATIGKAAFQGLDSSVDPLLTTWTAAADPPDGDRQAAPEGQGQGHRQLPQGRAGHAFDGDALASPLFT